MIEKIKKNYLLHFRTFKYLKPKTQQHASAFKPFLLSFFLFLFYCEFKWTNALYLIIRKILQKKHPKPLRCQLRLG